MLTRLDSVLAVVALLSTSCDFTSAEERVRYVPRSCIDCQGNAVLPWEYYFDGCNVCFCYEQNISQCTRKRCKWNKCYQIEKDENERTKGNIRQNETNYGFQRV